MAAIISRLRGRSFRELRDRSRQQMSILRELASVRSRRELTDTEMLDEFLPSALASGDSSQFKTEEAAALCVEQIKRGFKTHPIARSLLQTDDIARLMAIRFPKERLALIRKADRALHGKFDIFGNCDIDFGQPINWRLEPVAGKESPLRHWSRIDYLDASVAGDKKITWELNRHSHFIALGQAYVMTGLESYVWAFVEQASAWMNQNPPNKGINWSSSLELALRSIAWIWAISLFANSRVISGAFLKRIVKHLIAHAEHIEAYLSTYFSPNTHLTGEALGLLYLGTAFPQCRRAAVWKRTGLAVLLDELSRQVQDDGVYFEPSSYYHRYTVDFYLSLLQLARENSIQLCDGIESRLESMIDYLMWITRPDGRPTLAGDDDGGKLLMLGTRDPYDFRDSLAWGAALLGRARWKYTAGPQNPELLWLLGPEGLDRFDRLSAERPAGTDRAFTTSGQFVVRDGWEPDSTYLFFRCGPPGPLSGAHDHSDQLSFEFFAKGTAWLVDPGTYTYTADEQARNQFRLTSGHNTLTVNGSPQSVPLGPFSWRGRALGTPVPIISNHRFACVGGSHNGYEALPGPVRHQRCLILFQPDDRPATAMPAYLVVIDYIDSDSEHFYDLSYHFGPEIGATSSGAEFTARDSRGNVLHIAQFGSLDFRAGTSIGQVSRHYGQRDESTIGWVKAAGSGRQVFSSVLLPNSSESFHQMSIRQSAQSRAISVQCNESQDLLLFGDGRMSAAGLSIESAARVAWIRMDGPTILSAAVIDGKSLAIDGLIRLVSIASPRYICADFTGPRLSVYSDDPDSIVADIDSYQKPLEINGGSATPLPVSRSLVTHMPAR